MVGVRFAIRAWAACAPGLCDPSAWLAWARAPWRPEGELQAGLDAMAPLHRRRLNALGRAAAWSAWNCHAPAADVPVVFASGYGDAQRCLHALKEFAAAGTVSPTEFTFSVHNAISAMYSISRADGANYSSVAAGPASAAAGVVEACALLADGASEVLLACYDAPLPGEYADFHGEPASPYAWAWRIAAPEPGQPHCALAWSPETEAAAPSDLPFGLQALRFAVSGEPLARMHAQGRCWTWSRHA